MYITKAEFENYLWIEFEEWDTTPDIIINGVEQAVNSYIGADWELWILKQEYEEEIDIRSIILNADWYNIYLKHWPVATREKFPWWIVRNPIFINWEELIPNQDVWWVVRWRQLIVKDLDCIHNPNNPKDRRNRIVVKYTAWYWDYDETTQTWTNIPEDIKMVCLFLSATIFLTRQFVGMTNYRLWDESISLWSQRFIYWSPMVAETLKKYRKIYIAY